MVRILFATLLASVLAALIACQQVPQSTEAPAAIPLHSSAKLMQSAAAGGSAPARGSPYAAAIVKDLDLAGVGPVRPELAAVFGAAFREALQREGYVRLALPADSTADVVTIQPAAMRISPSYELEIAVAVRDPRGRFLGWYAVQYSAGLGDASPVSRNEMLRRVFADAGEQAAKAIAKAR